MGKLSFLRNSNYRRTVRSILLIKTFCGLVEMMFGPVNVSFSLPEWQDVKMTFFAPSCYKEIFMNLSCFICLWWAGYVICTVLVWRAGFFAKNSTCLLTKNDIFVFDYMAINPAPLTKILVLGRLSSVWESWLIFVHQTFQLLGLNLELSTFSNS